MNKFDRPVSKATPNHFLILREALTGNQPLVSAVFTYCFMLIVLSSPQSFFLNILSLLIGTYAVCFYTAIHDKLSNSLEFRQCLPVKESELKVADTTLLIIIITPFYLVNYFSVMANLEEDLLLKTAFTAFLILTALGGAMVFKSAYIAKQRGNSLLEEFFVSVIVYSIFAAIYLSIINAVIE